MANLQVRIKSGDIDSVMKVTGILYQLIEEKEIESLSINKIKKGEHSLDFNSLAALLNNNQLLETIIGGIGIEIAYRGVKFVHEIISTIKDGIDLSEKIKGNKSFMGLQCKIGRQSIVKFGRSYGIEYFDTIVTSATPQSLEETFLAKKEWGEIPIAREKYLLIKYVAIFVKTPVRAITWVGKVKNITYNPVNKKSTIHLDGFPRDITPIPYDDKCPQHNGHGTVYTTMARIEKAKTLCDVYPSLNQ